MFPNILDKICSDAAGILSTLKCLTNLGVGADLPPPGGAAAQNNVESYFEIF
jgi:hypothetical protein